jgi:hypothetical protein
MNSSFPIIKYILEKTRITRHESTKIKEQLSKSVYKFLNFAEDKKKEK